MKIDTIDLLVIIAYFLMVFGIAGWVTIKEKVTQNSSSYFLGGRNLGWFVIGASLFASNIGSEHLVGLAGSGATSGVAVGQFEILAGFMLLVLGWIFVPFYLRSNVFTMPEFLEKRYGPSARTYLSWVSIIAYVLTKISVTIAAGGIVFETIGINFWTGAIIIVVATGIYTIVGGLKAVLYTDMIQMFVLIGGSVTVTAIGLTQLGGWGEMQNIAGESFFDMWQPVNHPDFPWTGILFGAPILGVWYWCTDQFIVQRVLSAKNITNARKGTIFAGFLKMLPLFLFVIPGVIAYSLSQKGMLILEDKDQALAALINNLVPVGLKGIILAGLLAALMSSLSSVFNSCSTLFTIDIYKRYRPETSEKRLVLIGQSATFIMVILGLLWIPFMENVSDQLYKYLQSVQGYISPPIAAVFLLGLFFRRINTKGAMASLLTGLALGTIRLVAELNRDSLSGFMYDMASINFLHFAIILFAICSAVLIAVSLATTAPDYEKIKGLVYEKREQTDKSVRSDFILTMILIVIIFGLWIYFS